MLYYTDTTSTSQKLYVELHEGKMSRKYSNAVVHRRKNSSYPRNKPISDIFTDSTNNHNNT